MAAKFRKRQRNESLLPTQRVFRPYTQALGEIALAWNGLHRSMMFMFSLVMGGGVATQFFAVWNAIRNDRAQRAVLLAAAKTVFEGLTEDEKKHLAAEVEWLTSQATRVEDARDNALHSPFLAWQHGGASAKVHPDSVWGHPRAKKLAEKPNLLAELRWCRDAALVLDDYVKALDEYLSRRGPAAWPDRPSLPNRGQTNAPTRTRLPVPPAKRSPPHRSSRK